MMDNYEKLIQTFAQALGVDPSVITDELEFNSIEAWDSVAHMALVAALEEAFDIMLDTDDIIAMSSPAKAREILKKYGVDF
jgi:acyl carrier protein